MNARLKILKEVLLECVDNIDKGNSNHTEKELDEIIKTITKLNKGIKRYSKREACDKILHCSGSTFDKYIALGLIPKGHKEVGFKELSWSESDFNESVMYRIKQYQQNH